MNRHARQRVPTDMPFGFAPMLDAIRAALDTAQRRAWQLRPRRHLRLVDGSRQPQLRDIHPSTGRHTS